MPIECGFQIQSLSQDAFHAIDRIVMRHAFDIQNELGRFCNEAVYQNELVFRCRADGFEVLPEAVICVTHHGFRKLYYLDVLINQGSIFELKAVDLLVGQNEKQLITYLILAGLQHGKLINFGPASVEHRFVSTQLISAVRYNIQIDKNCWDEVCPEDKLVRETVCKLLEDWGSFLDVTLYKEALLHFLGGYESRVRPVEVCIGGRIAGEQKVCLLQNDTELHVSSIKRNQSSYRKHIIRLFEHTRLDRIQWINFNQNKVELITLKK